MGYEFLTDRPIYLQLVELFSRRIVSGQLARGAKLGSVRDMATEFGVNPNTMQRALADLESTGLVYSNRTAGRYITEDEQLIAAVQAELADKVVDDFLQSMQAIGIAPAAVMPIIEKQLEEVKL